MNRYLSFTELSRHEVENRDYRIHLRLGTSGIAVVAPHGGKIERGTLPIANAIAGDEHTFYGFEGIKPTVKANRVLHVPSNNFDEPRALFAVAKAHRVLTLHGAKGTEQAVYAGGLDLELRLAVLRALNAAGFTADHDPSPTRQGRGPTNICNCGKTGKGLQLELTFGLRRRMFGHPDEQGFRRPTASFHQFVMSIREVLHCYCEQRERGGDRLQRTADVLAGIRSTVSRIAVRQDIKGEEVSNSKGQSLDGCFPIRKVKTREWS